MIQKKHIGLLILIVISGLLLDQVSKILIVHTLTPFQPPVNVIGTLLRFKLTYNPYGIFSLSFGPKYLYYIFSSIGLVVLTYVGLTMKDRTSMIVFGLIIAGAIGNLIDRIRLNYVIDFIDMGVGNLRWFTYNPADAFITVGAVYLIVRELFRKKVPVNQQTTTQTQE